MTRIIVIIYALLLAFFVFVGLAQAEISEDQAVACLLGETRSEPSAFLAHAEVLRRRGSTRGIYGCNVSLTREMPYIKAKKLDLLALKAWRESEHTNVSNGAMFWEGKAFKTPYWARSMYVVYETKLTRFYK